MNRREMLQSLTGIAAASGYEEVARAAGTTISKRTNCEQADSQQAGISHRSLFGAITETVDNLIDGDGVWVITFGVEVDMRCSALFQINQQALSCLLGHGSVQGLGWGYQLFLSSASEMTSLRRALLRMQKKKLHADCISEEKTEQADRWASVNAGGIAY